KRRVLLSILAIFGSLCLFAQNSTKSQIAPSTRELSNSVESLTEKTKQLSSDNQALTKEIEELSGQIKKLEDEVGIYREDVRSSISNYYDRLNNWLVILTLVGLVAPLIINKNYEEKFNKSLDSLHAQLDEVSRKAQTAQEAAKASGELKKQIDDIKATVESMSREAEESANKARMSQLFSEALSESNPQKKIELYTKYIELNPDSAVSAYCNRGAAKASLKDFYGAIIDYNKAIELDPQKTAAYYNRGNAKNNLKNFDGAIDDYSKAIELDPKLKPAYNNRAIAYKNLAAKTKDAEKKKEYLAKAKADEEKAKSLEEAKSLENADNASK
ncbi:MAG: tetratricopeptide repeat protein, partial [Bacteroidales bacterium]|nr:tetratricopeptide repeat protein [Bacteroidales bacterium]